MKHLAYRMCPECYSVFFPSEFDPSVLMGVHQPDCSQPKLELYQEDREEIIKKLDEDKAIKKKWKS